MKTIKMKNCHQFMTIMTWIGRGFSGTKEFDKIWDKKYFRNHEDSFKAIQLLVAVGYWKNMRHRYEFNFRKFVNDLTGKNKSAIQFEWDDGTIVKLEKDDFINSYMWKSPDGTRNPYWRMIQEENRPDIPVCPKTPMQFLFNQGFFDTVNDGSQTHFDLGNNVDKYIKRSCDFLFETPYFQESVKRGSYYFPCIQYWHDEYKKKGLAIN
tara:strand:+ start:57 stop:683 length:627 start_codon:yes stop_codon:yes gene_type:complete